MSVQPTPVAPPENDGLRTISELVEATLHEPWFSPGGKAALCGRLEIEFENYGDGKFGLYDPANRDDVNYLHLSAYLTIDRPEHDDSVRIPIEGCSVRTLVPAATLPIVLRNLLGLVIERARAAGFDPIYHHGGNPPDLEPLFRSLTYLAPSWAA
jgi:hypothetical protein